MEPGDVIKTTLRDRGQVTLPSEIRKRLNVETGDDLLFHLDERGRVIVSRAKTIHPDQEWFWSDRWQKMEFEAQDDIDSGRISRFEDVDHAIADLESLDHADH